MQQQEVNGLEGVTFTADESEAVRQWAQDRAAQVEIVSSPSRLYLPVYSSMTIVEEGDTIWFDPASPKPNAFRIDRA